MSYHALDGRLLLGPGGDPYEALGHAGKPCCASCAAGGGCEGGLSGLVDQFPGGKIGIALVAAGLAYAATRGARRNPDGFAVPKPPKKPPQPKVWMVRGEAMGRELSWGPMTESAAKGKMTFYGKPKGIKVKNLRMERLDALEQVGQALDNLFFFFTR